MSKIKDIASQIVEMGKVPTYFRLSSLCQKPQKMKGFDKKYTLISAISEFADGLEMQYGSKLR